MQGIAIFFLLCFFFFLVYMVYGSILRYRRGIRQFPMALPHYSFWCRLTYYALLIGSCGRLRWSYSDNAEVDIFGEYGGAIDLRMEDEEGQAKDLAFSKGVLGDDGMGPSRDAPSSMATALANRAQESRMLSSVSRMTYGPPVVQPLSTGGGTRGSTSNAKVSSFKDVSTEKTHVMDPYFALSPPTAFTVQAAETMSHASRIGVARRGDRMVLLEENEDFELEAEMNPSEIVVVY